VNDKHQRELVGLIPAAGEATRISPLPCSKEIYPIGLRRVDGQLGDRPKVVCHYLLEKMRLAGITKAYIVLKKGKWDIPGYLCDGALVDMQLAYVLTGLSFGTPYTIDQAYSFVQHSTVAFGFPDIIFEPEDAFVRLLARQNCTNACVILGLFPADRAERVDMVDWDENGKVRQIISKPDRTRLSHSWCIAVWTPLFTQFLHDYIAAHRGTAEAEPEASVGIVIQAAIEAGLPIEATPVSEESYLDIGTAEGLMNAVRRYALA
jgi:glucose-1-phosphate thymidylyltransferase